MIMASGLVFPKHVVLEFMIVLLTLLATLQLTFALMRAAFLATSASERRGRLLGVLYAVFLCLDFVVMAAVCVSGAHGTDVGGRALHGGGLYAGGPPAASSTPV